MGAFTSRSLEVDPLEEICNSSYYDPNCNNLGHPMAVEATVSHLKKTAPEKNMKWKSFKQFDVVTDHSDHHYSKQESVKEVPKGWAKRIQNEWKVLEKNLPERIFVRAYEDRMDILRAVIIGSAGTPYHDGLFFFDVYFPQDYPSWPPLVHYHSGGLRLNPNLYASGTVCLSLLDTWYGHGCEKWTPKSTILQILVSIQALVLNAKPYFNEPGFSLLAYFQAGRKQALVYNENTFILSCKTMLYTLRRPPKHFEDFVADHFRKQGGSILRACRAYRAGAQVGCNLDAVQVQAIHVDGKNQPSDFETQLRIVFNDLLKTFRQKGVDCTGFLLLNDFKAGGSAKAPGYSLKLW